MQKCQTINLFFKQLGQSWFENCCADPRKRKKKYTSYQLATCVMAGVKILPEHFQSMCQLLSNFLTQRKDREVSIT